MRPAFVLCTLLWAGSAAITVGAATVVDPSSASVNTDGQANLNGDTEKSEQITSAATNATTPCDGHMRCVTNAMRKAAAARAAAARRATGRGPNANLPGGRR